MLILCPECELQVSDKAIFCPHCGYPMVSNIKRAYSKPTKRAHRKLPNGFGSITEIKGRYLRNPFLARISIGKTEAGRPILQNLKPKAYFKTYNEAYAALIEYHRNGYDPNKHIPFKELYKRWSMKHFEHKSKSMISIYQTCWKKCSDLYEKDLQTIEIWHLKNIIENEKRSTMKVRIKLLFDLMYDYAVEHGLTDRNISRLFKLSYDELKNANETKKPHKVISDENINKLWKNQYDYWAKLILIQCYTGMRPSELLNMRMENVHDKYLIGGMKTSAGKNRTIPLNEKIIPLVNSLRNQTEWLTEYKGKQVTYKMYSGHFKKWLPENRPHDTRKTFITKAKEVGMNDFAIKRIVGHSIAKDITENVYTERPIEWLLGEVNKL